MLQWQKLTQFFVLQRVASVCIRLKVLIDLLTKRFHFETVESLVDSCMTCEGKTSASESNLSKFDCQGSLSDCNGICQYTYKGGDSLSVKKE